MQLANLVPFSKALLLAGAFGIFINGSGGTRRDEGDENLQRVCVLPFQDLDPSPKTAGLGDGLADGIATRLNELGGLSVVGQNVIRKQGGGSEQLKLADLLPAARKLSLDTLIIGTYKKAGSKLEIECKIVDVLSGQSPEGKVLKVTEGYPKGYMTILANLPDQVAEKLNPSAASTSRPKAPAPQISFEANQLYASGLEKAKLGTQEGLVEAKDSFRQAVAKDPAFAQAYAAKADAEAQLARLESKNGQDAAATTDKNSAVMDALAAVKKAPYYGGAHWQMSRALTLVGDYENAAIAARVATALWPANGEVYLDLSKAEGQGKVVPGPAIQRAVQMSPALVLVAPELSKITVMNGGGEGFQVTFVQDGGKVFTSLQVPGGASRVVGLVAGKYEVKAVGGGATISETRDFGPGAVFSLDGRTLTTEAANKPLIDTSDKGGSGPDSFRQVKIARNLKTNSNMVYVFQGEFTMGEDDQAHNKPHRVNLSAYWIGQAPVTIGEFRAFEKASDGYQSVFGHTFDWDKNQPSFGWLSDDHPMVNVDWREAQAYCKWAGGDLPTEAQWEHAARGFSNFAYPWGVDWDPAKLQWSSGKVGSAHSTATVKGHESGKSPYGCLDMAGNVLQWCLDGYQDTPSSQYKDPIGSGKTKVVRGGSWDLNSPAMFKSAYRTPADPKKPNRFTESYRDETIGFRFAVPDER